MANKASIVEATQEEDPIREGSTIDVNPLESSVVDKYHFQDKTTSRKGIYIVSSTPFILFIHVFPCTNLFFYA